MGALADAVRAHKAKAFDKANTIVKETIETFGGRLVNEWTPLGDPLLWKAPPPADYKPGNLQSSWFYAPSRPSGETTEATNERHVHGLDRMPASALGIRHYLSNNAPPRIMAIIGPRSGSGSGSRRGRPVSRRR